MWVEISWCSLDCSNLDCCIESWDDMLILDYFLCWNKVSDLLMGVFGKYLGSVVCSY